MGEIICSNPECRRILTDTSDKYSTLEFGREMYFCSKPHMFNGNTDCLSYFRKKNEKKSIAYNGGGLGGVAKDFLGVTALKQELSQTATGAAAVKLGGLVGGAIKSYNSPEAKAARAAKEEERKRKQIQETIQRRIKFIENFAPEASIPDKDGLKKKLAISDALSDCEQMFYLYEKYNHGTYDYNDYGGFFDDYIDDIESKMPEALETLNKYNPKKGEKYQRKYKIIQCYKNIKEEVVEVGGENARKLNDNLTRQKELIDAVNNLSKELYSPLNTFSRSMKIYGANFKAIIPFINYSKDDAKQFAAECKQHVEDMKQALVKAKQDKKENLSRLKKEASEIKKTGDKELAEIKKKLTRFANYKPKAEEFEAELKKIENN